MQGESELQWKKVNETTYDISSKKRVTKKFPVADQDLQIRGEGEGGHPDPEIRVGAVSKKNLFGPSGLSLVYK